MIRLHPLHDADGLYQHMLICGAYPDKERGTGRSTAKALEFIAAAISAPRSPVLLVDHSHPKAHTYRCKAWFASLVSDYIERMQLRHIKCTSRNGEFYIQFGE